MVRRRARIALAVACLVLLLLLAPAGIVWRESSGKVLNPRGTVADLTFSADGSRIATITDQGLFRVWFVETAAVQTQHAFSFGYRLRDVAISPSLDAIAVVSSRSRLSVYSTETGDELVRLTVGDPLSDLRFSHDGRYIATYEPDGPRIWNAHAGTLVLEPYKPSIRGRRSEEYGSVSFSRGGDILTSGYHRKPRIWSSAGRLVRELDSPENGVVESCWSGDGDRIAVHTPGSKRLRVFGARDGALLLELPINANAPALSAAGEFLAVSAGEKQDLHDQYTLFAVPSGRRVGSFPKSQMAFSPTAPLIAWSYGSEVHVVPLTVLGRWRHLR
ncbi:MAG TPA: hypothetical protein VFF73_13230 [Planctomycetota bacterium]|nr:hypothetical protein [Planctomycetota bacterium]